MAHRRIAGIIKAWFTLCNVHWHQMYGDFFELEAAQNWPPISIPEYQSTLDSNDVRMGIIRLNWANFQIWHHEDFCRTGDPQLIAPNKQGIDKFNQKRNDFIEYLDEQFIIGQNECCPANSETLGSIIDRMSVTSLKIYHTEELIESGKTIFLDRLSILNHQLDFLVTQTDDLYLDVKNGKRRIQLFKQLKMYNDPNTNPHFNS